MTNMYKVRVISPQHGILQQTTPLPDWQTAMLNVNQLLQQHKAPVSAEILQLSRTDGCWVERVQETIHKQYDFPA